jgi:acetoin utilization protein AcuB
MFVRSSMSTKPIVIGPTESLIEARRKMEEGNFRRLPVVRDGRLIGIVTDRDLRQHTGHFEHTRVTAAMTDELITAVPEMRLEEAADLMVKHKVGGLPVTDGGNLVGIITTTDLLRAFSRTQGEVPRSD